MLPSKRIEIPDALTIQVPELATHYFANDDALLCIRFKTTPETELLIAQFEITADMQRENFLQSRIEEFCKLATKNIPQAQCMVGVDFRPGLGCYVAQGMIEWQQDEEHVWIVRGYHRNNGAVYYLLHWNGLKKDSEMLESVFESFVPLDL